MTQLTVSLPDGLVQFVFSQVSAGKYDDAGNYISELVSHDKRENERLEAMLIEGLDSGEPILLNSLEWARIRGEVAARLSK